MESIEQTFNGSAGFGKKVTCTISRNGDLIHRMYLRVKVPSVSVPANCQFRWLNWLGQLLIKSVEIEIGGQRIDKHYGEWLHVWNELSQSAGKQIGYANMVGNIPRLTLPTDGAATVAGEILYIPLEFWFNRNAGLALPLIALQYHEVKVNLEFRDKADCYFASGSGASSLSVGDFDECSLFVDYIYLDTDERRRFAQVSHEYLIEQLQFTGDETTSTGAPKIKLNFNHPVKELVWVVQPDKFLSSDASTYKGKQWFNFTDDWDKTYTTSAFVGGSNLLDPLVSNDIGAVPGVAAGGANGVLLPVSFESGVNPVKVANLKLNGHDRFSERDGRYFNLVQPYQHHENVPKAGINVYSFALKPEEHQPSGTCNMSRIDNATLQLFLTSKVNSTDTAKIKVYAISYNVLRVMSGMGGLAYSN